MRDFFVILIFLAGFALLLEASQISDGLWPKGNVPLKFSPSFTKAEISAIREAMKEIQERTCIQFRYKTPDDADYVMFARPNDSDRCMSHIGRQGAGQTIALGADCLTRRKILHELMHVLGFRHEHSRPDRDFYVTINWDNIQPKEKQQFGKEDTWDIKIMATGYAYDSIMHYTSDFGAKDKNIPVMVPKINSVQLGRGQGLSDIDVKRIKMVYKCPEKQ